MEKIENYVELHANKKEIARDLYSKLIAEGLCESDAILQTRQEVEFMLAECLGD